MEKVDYDKKGLILDLLEILDSKSLYVEEDYTFEHVYGVKEDMRHYYETYIYLDNKKVDKYLESLKKVCEYSDDEIREIKKEIALLEEYEIKDLNEPDFTTYITTINKKAAKKKKSWKTLLRGLFEYPISYRKK